MLLDIYTPEAPDLIGYALLAYNRLFRSKPVSALAASALVLYVSASYPPSLIIFLLFFQSMQWTFLEVTRTISAWLFLLFF